MMRYFNVGLKFDSLDHRALLIKLSEISPSLFLSLCDAPDAEPWMHEVVRLLDAGEVVPGIKAIRHATNMGLYEAKRTADMLRRRPDEVGFDPCPAADALVQKFAECGLKVTRAWVPPQPW